MRRLARITGITLLAVVLLAVGLHLLLMFRSHQLLNFIVDKVSKGQYVATATKVKFGYLPARLAVSRLQLKPKAIPANESYFIVGADSIHVELESLIGLFFYKRLGVTDLTCLNPTIEAFQKKKKHKEQKGIAEIVATLQEGLLGTLEALDVQNTDILRTRVTVHSLDDPDEYFSINNVSLHLRNIQLHPDTTQASKIAINGEITIDVEKPDIHVMNEKLSIRMGNLLASNVKHQLQIDSMQFIYRKEGNKTDSIALASIRISQLNWQRYLAEDVLELDSVVVEKGATKLDYSDRNLFGKAEASPGRKSVYLGQSVLIHHLGITDVNYTLVTKEGQDENERVSTFVVSGNSLVASELSITNNQSPALAVGDLAVNFTNYSDSNKAEKRAATLGAVRLSHDTLVLQQYKLQSREGPRGANDNRLIIPELRLEHYSLEDLLLKRLVASKLTVTNPVLVIDILKKKQRAGRTKEDPNTSIARITASLRKKIAINDIVLRNASIRMLPQGSNTDAIQISGFNLSLDGRQALNGKQVMDLMHSIKDLSTSGFTIQGKNLNLQVSDVKGLDNPRGMYLGHVKGTLGSGLEVDLEGVTVLNRNLTIDITDLSGLEASDVVVEKGTITINRNGFHATVPKDGKGMPPFKIHNLDLRSIVFRLKKDGKAVASSTMQIKASDLGFEENNVSWQTLHASGTSNLFENPNLSLSAGSMSVDQPGNIRLDQARAVWKHDNRWVDVTSPVMLMQLGITHTHQHQLGITSVSLEKPVIRLNLPAQASRPTVAGKIIKPPTPITLGLLELTDPVVELSLPNADSSKSATGRALLGKFRLYDISINAGSGAPPVQVGKIRFETNHAEAAIPGFQIHPLSAVVQLSSFEMNPAAKTWKTKIDTAKFGRYSYTWYGPDNDTLQASVAEAGISGIPFAKGDTLDPKALLGHPGGWVKDMEVHYRTPRQTIHLYGADFRPGGPTQMSWDSLHLLPRGTREAFWLAQPYEKDFITLKLGPSSIQHLRWTWEGKLPEIHIRQLNASGLNLLVERDKTRPEDTVTYRPLLARSFQSIPVPISIDTIALQKGYVHYNEIGGKSGLQGSIYFTGLRGYVTNFRNHGWKENDTLHVLVQARIQDKALLTHSFRQSYTDSLQGFWMRTKMETLNLPDLNLEFLVPLLGVKIGRGIADSMYLSVKGNDRMAYGRMDLRFHSLRVSVLKHNQQERYFLSKIINGLANILLRNSDNRKANLLFKERVRKRGTYNFWAKIATEGMLTNFGVKRDKREEKKFKKELKKQNLPLEMWKEENPWKAWPDENDKP